MSSAPHNIAGWSVTLDGRDLTSAMAPRLISLAISEKRGDEADQLDIVLDDSDGGLAIPSAGAVLEVSLGWKTARDAPEGIVPKGRYKVDDVSHGGPPDIITIRARAADFTSEIRTRREQTWRDVSLGDVVNDIAARNGLTPIVAGDLASKPVKALTQSRQSDIAFLKKLGGDHDAVATIKDGRLLFMKKGAGKTASGKTLPTIELPRVQTNNHNWSRQAREAQGGVTATWHDRAAAKRKSVTVGEAKGAKKLRKIYTSETEARRAATSERDKLARAPASMDINLGIGRADIIPEMRVKLIGFKPEIEATTWLVESVTHRLDGGGFNTSLRMETAP